MADRYEIKDDGKLIQIGCPDGCLETLRPTEPDVGVYLDDIVIAAIRQQQSDLAALKELLAGEVEANEAFRKSGGALDGEDMPTFCARMIAERDQLRAECNLLTHKVICCGFAATHENTLAIASAPYSTKWNSAQADSVRKLRSERDQLLARLAAIDAAPTVATVCIAPTSDFPVLKYSRYDIPRINGTELIARPAKDGGT